MSNRHPLIGVTSCTKEVEDLPSANTPLKYIHALQAHSSAVPVLIPAIGDKMDVESLLDHLDGILLTGSLSNVHPSHYGGTDEHSVPPHDAARDALTLRLIRGAVQRGVPLFAICRGYQELNVAMGGTLHPLLHEAENYNDHRPDKSLPRIERYGPSHMAHFAEGGLLAKITGLSEHMVNSLHEQGVRDVAPTLQVDATAPDGYPEALTCPSSPGFVLGVQWHPEALPFDDAVTKAVFSAFGEAASAYAATRSIAVKTA